jgi:predicted transport protein
MVTDSLSAFRNAIKSLDNQITLHKLEKYQFEETISVINVNCSEIKEKPRKEISLAVNKPLESKKIFNQYKTKLLSRLNC